MRIGTIVTRIQQHRFGPADLGVKCGIELFRPGQLEALQKIMEGEAKFFLLSAPTGSGKGLIGRAASPALCIEQAAYLTADKALQHQFVREFSDAALLMGRANYRLTDWPADVTCDDCNFDPGRGCSWCGMERTGCPYFP